MHTPVVLLSVPGLREKDLVHMPHLSQLTAGGERAELTASFPAVTCPVQANMTTGLLPCDHGVIANGFYWPETGKVEMWTAWNDCIQAPQIWDRLHEHDETITSAVWFPLHSKGCGADYVCTPAPKHNPDGTESLWCYTKPEGWYEKVLSELGHFPLHHFWGPLANIKSSAWIVASAIRAAHEFRPDFFYIYLQHLDYAAQKDGPESKSATSALAELDGEFGKLIAGINEAYAGPPPIWIVASEYTIVPVNHVTYPNRQLREAGFLRVAETDEGEQLDLRRSLAWALVDHQLAHLFVRDPVNIKQTADLFRGAPGVAEVLVGEELTNYGLDHSHSGQVVLVSESHSWQAYYWWLDDTRAPAYACNVDIHRKPGYDPVELFFDPVAKAIPLDATLVKGSHGAPVASPDQVGVILSSVRGVLQAPSFCDTDVAALVLRQFGVE